MPNLTDEQAKKLRARNNPEGKPTGHYTGRCGRCGSNDLWDDNMAYGCNVCGSFFTAGNFGL
jgi:hypothetical protein